MEYLHCLRETLQEGEFMCKLDMKMTHTSQYHFINSQEKMSDYYGQETFASSSVFVLVWTRHLKYLKNF